MLTTLSVVEHPLMPLSGSVAPFNSPFAALNEIGMLVCAVALLLPTVGGSLTGLTVIVNDWLPVMSTPLFAVPPLSWRL